VSSYSRGRRSLPVRTVSLAAGMSLAIGVLSAWWITGADERRVNGACDAWLEQRESLRTAVSEAEEAVGRARAAEATRTSDYFNDLDQSLAALRRWEELSPEVRSTLDDQADASRIERGAASSFDFVQEGVTDLRALIERGDAMDLEHWVPEVQARFQSVDDACLLAARS
jgi:hypothetical protein